jgi:threonine/homoserine/homoserine lactone efflux protein
LRHGSRQSVWANLGIVGANTFYFALSAIGLGAVLLASQGVYQAIRFLGAAYLIYLGLATFFGKGASVASARPEASSEPPGARLFGRGFIVQVANPKALVFFTALLPQFVTPGAGVGWQVFILGLSSVVIEFIVLGFYGLAAGKASELARRPRFVTITNRISGVLLIAAGAGLALTERSG